MTSVRRPIRSIGPRALRARPHMSRGYKAVDTRIERAGGGCERCGVKGVRLEHNHTFGRGHSGLHLGDRWANHPTLIHGLCRSCHRTFHADADVSREARQQACADFERALFRGARPDDWQDYTPEERMLTMVRWLDEDAS